MEVPASTQGLVVCCLDVLHEFLIGHGAFTQVSQCCCALSPRKDADEGIVACLVCQHLGHAVDGQLIGTFLVTYYFLGKLLHVVIFEITKAVVHVLGDDASSGIFGQRVEVGGALSLLAQCQTLTVDGDAYNGFVLVGPMARHKHY